MKMQKAIIKSIPMLLVYFCLNGLSAGILIDSTIKILMRTRIKMVNCLTLRNPSLVLYLNRLGLEQLHNLHLGKASHSVRFHLSLAADSLDRQQSNQPASQQWHLPFLNLYGHARQLVAK